MHRQNLFDYVLQEHEKDFPRMAMIKINIEMESVQCIIDH